MMSPLPAPSDAPYGPATPGLSRREFLKLAGLGLWLGLLAPRRSLLDRLGLESARLHPAEALEALKRQQSLDPGQQGRVLETNIPVLDAPNFSANKVNTYWRDRVLPISDIVVSEDTTSHNLIWYRIGEEGYAHSSGLQPVRTILNDPVTDLPANGTLAKVTVPYTDGRWTYGRNQLVAYRFYYETTYWVTGIEFDDTGEAWYSILDDKWDYTFFAPAQHFHLLAPEEMTPLSPRVPHALKRIEVHIPEQVLVAYEWDEPVFMARVATGAKFSNGDFSTPLGRHVTFHKRPSRHMAAGNLAANGYDLPGVPWNSYITEEGVAFHGTYWHNNFGRPRSHGCINLIPQAAEWVFRWTLPSVPFDQQFAFDRAGTAVDILG
jgi:hypothetical protein